MEYYFCKMSLITILQQILSCNWSALLLEDIPDTFRQFVTRMQDTHSTSYAGALIVYWHDVFLTNREVGLVDVFRNWLATCPLSIVQQFGDMFFNLTCHSIYSERVVQFVVDVRNPILVYHTATPKTVVLQGNPQDVPIFLNELMEGTIHYSTTCICDFLYGAMTHDDVDDNYHAAKAAFAKWCLWWSSLFKVGTIDLFILMSFDPDMVIAIINLIPIEDNLPQFWAEMVSNMVRGGFFSLVFNWYDCLIEPSVKTYFAKIVAHTLNSMAVDTNYSAKTVCMWVQFDFNSKSFKSWLRENPDDWRNSNLILEIQRELICSSPMKLMKREFGHKWKKSQLIVELDNTLARNPQKRSRS